MQKKNKFKKNFSKDDININDLINKENLINPYSNIDFYKFLVKFCGSFIYRGKKSYSYKLYDYFLYNLKNNFKKNPIKIFSKIIKNLMPFLIVGKKSFKGKLLFMPILAKGNKKNVLIINSLIRQLKGKSYTNGVIKGDVLRVLIDTYNLKGSALNLKKDHYIEALKVRRNIKTSSHLYKVVKKWKFEKKNKKKKKFLNREEDEKMKENDIFLDNLKKYNIPFSLKFYNENFKNKKNGAKFIKKI